MFAFTYRIVHPDGQIDWLGSPSNDGQIHLQSVYGSIHTIQQLVQPQQGTHLETANRRNSYSEYDEDITLATLASPERDGRGNLSFSIKSSSVHSGLVIERTKSTWCTSRRFQSLDEVSPDFGSNLLILQLTDSALKEVLVVMPVFDDAGTSPRLVRGSCNGDTVTFNILRSELSTSKISIALGTADKLEQTVVACRSNGAKSLRSQHSRTAWHWLVSKKSLDSDSSLSTFYGHRRADNSLRLQRV